MPYRSEEPLRVYPLRSSVASRVIAVGLAVLVLPLVAWLGWPLLRYGVFLGGWTSWLLLGTFVLTAVAYAVGVRNDSVAGPNAELRLFSGHVEVPRAFRGAPMSFPLKSLRVHVQRIEGRVWFTTVSVVEVLRLSGEGQKRGLSSRTFASLDRFRELVADLAALQRGLPLPSHDGADAPYEGERDAYDDKLEAELDAID